MSQIEATNEHKEVQIQTEQQVFIRPHVDIYEVKGDTDELILVADLPGVSKEKLDIKFHDDQLTIEGISEETEGKSLFNFEQPKGFRRSFSIEDKLDVEHITAELKEGVLTIRMPKSPDLKVRQIAINA